MLIANRRQLCWPWAIVLANYAELISLILVKLWPCLPERIWHSLRFDWFEYAIGYFGRLDFFVVVTILLLCVCVVSGERSDNLFKWSRLWKYAKQSLQSVSSQQLRRIIDIKLPPPSQLCKRACSYFWESAIRSKIRKSNYANCGASRGADVSFLSFLFVNRLVRILAGPTGTNWIESKRLNSRLDWYNYANRKVMNWNPIYHVNKVSFKRPSEGI